MLITADAQRAGFSFNACPFGNTSVKTDEGWSHKNLNSSPGNNPNIKLS